MSKGGERRASVSEHGAPYSDGRALASTEPRIVLDPLYSREARAAKRQKIFFTWILAIFDDIY